jgi:hypothetical protein
VLHVATFAQFLSSFDGDQAEGGIGAPHSGAQQEFPLQHCTQ